MRPLPLTRTFILSLSSCCSPLRRLIPRICGITGVGYALIFAKEFLLSDQLIAMMFVIGIVGLLLDRLLGLVERFVFRWKITDAKQRG